MRSGNLTERNRVAAKRASDGETNYARTAHDPTIDERVARVERDGVVELRVHDDAAFEHVNIFLARVANEVAKFARRWFFASA